MPEVRLFHWVDYLVFAVFLLGSSAIGFYAGWKDRKNSSTKHYLTGGRSMHWFPTSLSLQATFLSAVSVLSTPAEIYYFGTMFLFMVTGCAAALPVTSHVVLAIFYKLNLVSAYQYLEMRYNKTVRIIGASTFFIMVILYNSILLYTPAIALAQVTGLSINISILLCGSICSVYTFLGGMKGTIWIDTMQVLIIFVSFFFLIIFGTIRVGGVSKIWEVNKKGGRIVFDDFRLDPTLRNTFWTMAIGFFVSTFCLWTSNQTIIQKFISVRSLKDAHKTSYFNAMTNAVFVGMSGIVGLISYAFFEGCDPLLAGKISKFDQIVPLLVMEVTGHLYGFPGIFIASIFSASLSSLSGALTAMSAVTMYDFVMPLYSHVKGQPMKDRPKSIITKSLIIAYGMMAIGCGYLAQYMGESLLQMSISIFGFVGGPLSSLLVVGILFPFVNKWGAMAGLACSLVTTSWMAVGSIVVKPPLPVLPVSADRCSIQQALNVTLATIASNATTPALADMAALTTPWFYRLSPYLYALIATVVSISVAVPVSLISGRTKSVDPRLSYDLYRKCCCCPESTRKCLQCDCGCLNDHNDVTEDDTKDVEPGEGHLLEKTKV